MWAKLNKDLQLKGGTPMKLNSEIQPGSKKIKITQSKFILMPYVF